MPMTQNDWNVRCEWGRRGIEALADYVDALVIVDVLSFSTTVCAAVERGATVYPYRHRDESAAEFAASRNARLAGPRHEDDLSLSPQSMSKVGGGDRVVLPSPNGSTLSLAVDTVPTFAGCFRNARAVASTASACGPNVAVIPAGEQWPDGNLRPCVEDLLAAGAIIEHLPGTRSPEAQLAEDAFKAVADEASVRHRVIDSGTGRALLQRGFGEDIDFACELNASATAPQIVNGAYVDRRRG
jgi:2-phosphosulfolactate phosphatase